jgi:hypothetical protein
MPMELSSDPVANRSPSQFQSTETTCTTKQDKWQVFSITTRGTQIQNEHTRLLWPTSLADAHSVMGGGPASDDPILLQFQN